jgi:hypothetical protein
LRTETLQADPVPMLPAFSPEPAAAQPDKLEQLKQLGELKASRVLTDADFEAQKVKVLAG